MSVKEHASSKDNIQPNTSRFTAGADQMLEGEVSTAIEVFSGAWKGALVGGVVGAGIRLAFPIQDIIVNAAKYGATTGMYIGRERAIQKFNKDAHARGYKKVGWIDQLTSYIVIVALLDWKKPIASITRTDKIVTMLLANAITIRGVRRLALG